MTRGKPFILGVIPARAGSKGFPGKNLAPLAGRPLIAHSVACALGAETLSDFVVTSDGDDILNAAAAAGAKRLIRRPAELARDDTPTFDAVWHAVTEYERGAGRQAGFVMVLQPTAPLRTPADVDAAAALMAKHPEAQSLVSCYDASAFHPAIMYRRDGDFGVRVWPTPPAQRRQEFEKIYIRNGAVYLARRELLSEGRVLYDERPLLLEMPRDRSVNVDDAFDLALAERILSA